MKRKEGRTDESKCVVVLTQGSDSEWRNAIRSWLEDVPAYWIDWLNGSDHGRLVWRRKCVTHTAQVSRPHNSLTFLMSNSPVGSSGMSASKLGFRPTYRIISSDTKNCTRTWLENGYIRKRCISGEETSVILTLEVADACSPRSATSSHTSV